MVVVASRPSIQPTETLEKFVANPHSRRAAADRVDGAPRVVATDLDGAVADGPVATRRALYRALRRRGNCLLFYVTAKRWREVGALQQSLGLPMPDVIIADNGGTVWSDRFAGSLTPLQMEIDSTRSISNELFRELASVLQPLRQTGKFQYTIETRAGFLAVDILLGVQDLVRERGHDARVVSNQTVEIAPRHLSKGATLLRVLDWLSVLDDRVVVGGNRLLADPVLADSGLAGFALANSPAGTRRLAESEDHLYVAEAPFSSGVLEGLQHFGVLRGRLI